MGAFHFHPARRDDPEAPVKVKFDAALRNSPGPLSSEAENS
jgi:hypothetical protein